VSDEPDEPHASSSAAPASPAAPADVAPAAAAADPVFEALWKRVLETWSDDKAHNALLEHAIRAEQLPVAAGRYRALKDDSEKGERARKRLDAIVIAATQMMMAMKSPPARGRVPWPVTLFAVLVCFALLTWLAWVVFHRHRYPQ
jgi:hypothetical protein